MNREINSLRSLSAVRRQRNENRNNNKRTRPRSPLLMDYSKDRAILGGDNSSSSLRRPRRTAMTVGFSDDHSIEEQSYLDKKSPKEETAAVTFHVRKSNFVRSNSSPLLQGTAAAEDTAILQNSFRSLPANSSHGSSVEDGLLAQVLSKRSNSDPTGKAANRGRSPPPPTTRVLKKLRSNRSISPTPSLESTSSSSHHPRRTPLIRSPLSQRTLVMLRQTDRTQSMMNLLTDHSDSSGASTAAEARAERRLRGMQKRAGSYRQLQSSSSWNTLNSSSNHSRGTSSGGGESSPLNHMSSTFVTGSRIRRHR